MSTIAFDLEPSWFAQQLKLSRAACPVGGRIRKNRERVLIGYVDGVLILVFPRLQVSMASPGTGEGWFSLNPYSLEKLLETYSSTVRVEVDPTLVRVQRYQTAHATLALRLGSDDPELQVLAERIEEIAAEECHRRLVAAGQKQRALDEHLAWHRADQAGNAAPLLEQIREGSLIVFRLPEAPADSPTRRAVVERKQIFPDKVYLLCRDFHGTVTHVAW